MKSISNKRRDAIFATINDAVETYNTQRATIVEQIDALLQELEDIRGTYESTVQPVRAELAEMCDEDNSDNTDAWWDVLHSVPELDKLPAGIFGLEDADTPDAGDFRYYMNEAPTGDE